MSLIQGIHQISAETYHADPCVQPSLSNSLMTVLLKQTPRHAWLRHPRLNPAYEAEVGGGAFDIGTAAHAMLLEGENIATVIDAEDWRTKAAQEARDKAYLAGKIPLLSRQHAAVQEMLHAALAYIDSTSLKGILGRGKAEQTLIWRSANVWCRARLSASDVIEIRQRRESGESTAAIGTLFGVHPSTISRIARGVWRTEVSL